MGAHRTALVALLLAAIAVPTLGGLAPPPHPATPQPDTSFSPIQTPLPLGTPFHGNNPGPNLPTALPSGLATAPPTGVLVRYAGQILDVRSGYIFFTTGDGFALDPNVRYVDYFTGKATTIPAALRIYGRAAFDPVTKRVVEVGLSRKQIPPEASYAAAHEYAVTASAVQENPELRARNGFTGRVVPVTFTTLVPSTTKLNDDVYMETDQSGWNPQAIKLDRIDALHYRVTLRLPSGSEFLYRYTRGSAQSVEQSRGGIEQPARHLLVPEADVKNEDDTVYNWADTNPAAGQNSAPNPDSIPTPFNPNPFPVPLPRKTLRP
jgi:hypothetical protein